MVKLWESALCDVTKGVDASLWVVLTTWEGDGVEGLAKHLHIGKLQTPG